MASRSAAPRSRPAERASGGRENEVVAVVRPEEIEVAANRGALRCGYLAQGVVDSAMFTGALERLRLRLETQPQAPLLTLGDGEPGATLQVTRTQYEQRLFEVHPGQSVAIGVRRVHVLPTPLSSFTACAPSAQLAEQLSRQPLLAELAARMKTRIGTRTEPQLGQPDAPCQGEDTFVGTTVIAAYPDSAERAEWLLRRGARDLLVLPDEARAAAARAHSLDRRSGAQRDARGLGERAAARARRGGLRRRVPRAGGDAHPQGMRELLDARSEAQAAHGLEMRTELHFGDAEQQLARRLAESPAQMLIIGVGHLAQFTERFRALLEGGRWPVLIVHRGLA